MQLATCNRMHGWNCISCQLAPLPSSSQHAASASLSRHNQVIAHDGKIEEVEGCVMREALLTCYKDTSNDEVVYCPVCSEAEKLLLCDSRICPMFSLSLLLPSSPSVTRVSCFAWQSRVVMNLRWTEF